MPTAGDRFAMDLRGARLETPIGVAAGPHTQLAQNIVVAWLCGARVIELKTVQTLDRIEVAKPCIDMQDDGYNIEWSQELGIRESFNEYLTAWVLIHALHARPRVSRRPARGCSSISASATTSRASADRTCSGFSITWRMPEPSSSAASARSRIRFPGSLDLDIPSRLADSVTLSTLHGCPPR